MPHNRGRAGSVTALKAPGAARPRRGGRDRHVRRRKGRGRAWLAVLGTAWFSAGCAQPFAEPPEPLVFPYPQVQRLAVAPVLNFSGQEEFDPVRAADLLASELTQVRGVAVAPVNRVVAALARQGELYVQSPVHAVAVCRAVGCDAILIPAVTEYDPYRPMKVALAMELYVVPEKYAAVAPAAATEADREAVTGGPGRSMAVVAGPVAQVQAVFDASHQAVARRVRAYAATRSAGSGPFAWRRYLVTQEGFLRFCFHSGLASLFGRQSNRMMVARATDE